MYPQNDLHIMLYYYDSVINTNRQFIITVIDYFLTLISYIAEFIFTINN